MSISYIDIVKSSPVTSMEVLLFPHFIYVQIAIVCFTVPLFFLFGPSSQCPVHLILICLLSKCRYYTPKPIFKYKSAEEAYECELTLPSNAPFQTIVGPTSRNKNLSKQLVCLEACEKLHQVGALNDHLLPSVEEPSENNLISKKNESLPGAGMHMYIFV